LSAIRRLPGKLRTGKATRLSLPVTGHYGFIKGG
jgi:hypothetical protein